MGPRHHEGGGTLNASALRRIPSMHRVLEALSAWPPAAVRYVAEKEFEALRSAARSGREVPPEAEVVAAIEASLQALKPHLRRVINGTGVVVHTNLGRAPVAHLAAQAIADAFGYTDVELDLASGKRSSRLRHLSPLLEILTGAEAGLAVNNNAAGVFLGLKALCTGKSVLISRGEEVEIGGSFRIPDVLRESGAELIEVGTTNRTRTEDYRRAITSETVAILRVHPSNFRQIGFTERPPLEDLAEAARANGLLLLDDLGSGAFTDPSSYGLEEEPTVASHVAAGSDLVFFSGDKLLGGPQAGLVVGRPDLVERLRSHPLYRALRLDKFTLAALKATLYLSLFSPEEVPVQAMLSLQEETLRGRAEELASALSDLPGATVTVGLTSGAAGGGALPEAPLSGYGVFIRPQGQSEERLAAALRAQDPALLGRVQDGMMVLDPRTFLPGDMALAVDALRKVLSERG